MSQKLVRYLHQAPATEMIVHGLSFDVKEQLQVGQTLVVLVPQPDIEKKECLVTRVCWCREL